MQLKYLYTARVGELTPEDNAEEGEPVIPAFPILDNINTFISTVSFKPSYYAKVKEQELDVDALCEQCRKEYPDMPLSIIETYILGVLHASVQLEEHAIVQAYITQDCTKIRDIKTDKIITLWASHPK